ncbi:MAG TPA: DUF4252 domain-containing protein [Gammaproteobacteria bacterium]|nr:DUF4252 domain-containing protein [Gammaproteobacteria bacterium]
MIRKIVYGCVVFVISGAAAAQGAFNFNDIPGIDQEPTLEVNLNSIAIGFFIAVIQGVDPEGAELLRGLRGIQLRVYQHGENARQFNNFINDVTEELTGSGWQAVVSAQDGGSNVRMYMQMTEEEVSGMTIMASDGAEAIFMNIDGTITAADLGRIMALPPVREALGAFHMPAPVTARPTDQ